MFEKIIYEIGYEAPPYIILTIGLALLALLSSYIIFLVGLEAPIWRWKKGLFRFFIWVSLLFFYIAGLLLADSVYIIIETPLWWQLLIKCLLMLSFFTLVFLISELVHFIKDIKEF